MPDFIDRFDDLPQEPREFRKLVRDIESRVSGKVKLPEQKELRQAGPFSSVQRFYETSFQCLRDLMYFTSIRSDHRILDYGCGLARLAIPMVGYLDRSKGSYHGIDTNRNCISRNTSMFAEFANIDFEFVDIYSSMYNKTGKSFETLSSYDLKGPYDVIALFSVFTHLLPSECNILIQLLARHLRRKGEIFSTWFLLDEDSEGAIKAGRSHREFSYEYENARIDNSDIPAGAVAFQRHDVVRYFESSGLEVSNIHAGEWRGLGQTGVWQDVVVARPVRKRFWLR